jgi:hypothetical protein
VFKWPQSFINIGFVTKCFITKLFSDAVSTVLLDIYNKESSPSFILMSCCCSNPLAVKKFKETSSNAYFGTCNIL